MKHSLQKILAVLLAVVLVVMAIPIPPLSAQAASEPSSVIGSLSAINGEGVASLGEGESSLQFPLTEEAQAKTQKKQEKIALFQAPTSENFADFNIEVEHQNPANPADFWSKNLADYVEISEFRNYLVSRFQECPTTVDITSFAIPISLYTDIADFIFYDSPELFHVLNINDFKYNQSTGKLTSIVLDDNTYPTFCDTKQEYTSLMEAVDQKADELLADLRGNNLSRVEKLLLLHDRLVVLCKYDSNEISAGKYTQTSYEMVGALVEGVSVCQGYAEAYNYLLRQLDIPSYMITSQAINHAWNIVYIGDMAYHVDVTWDDTPTKYDLEGQVSHKNFLRSEAGIRATGHEMDDDYAAVADSTYYDSGWYWQDSYTEVLSVNNKLYYFDSVNGQLKSTDSSAALATQTENWFYGQTQYYTENQTRITTNGTDIFFSAPKTVYCYKPYQSGAAAISTVFTPELSGYSSIYGLTYEKESDSLVYDTTASLSEAPTNHRQNLTAPKAVLSVNNIDDSTKKVTMSFTSDIGVSGYYFGQSPNLNENSYYATTSTSASQNVYEPGTYYLFVVDVQGAVSARYEVSFSRLILKDGSETVRQLLVQSGKKITLPTLTNSPYTFCGWSKNSKATNGSKEYTLYDNVTLYAIWRLDKPGKSATPKLTGFSTSSMKISGYTVSKAAGYQIYVSTTKKSYYTTASSYTLSKLTSGKSYSVKVRAYNLNDKNEKVYGDWSAYAKAKTLPVKMAKPKVAAYGTSSIKVSWKKVSGADGYFVYNKTTGKYKATTGTSYTFTGLKPATKYTIYVRAYVTNSGKKYYGAYSSGLVPTKLKGILLNKTSATLCTKATTTLKATVYPSAKVYYKTSKSSVAKVSSKGVITAVKAGSATITAYFKYKGKTYSRTCKVTVKNPSISLNKYSATLYIGSTTTLKPKTFPSAKVYYKTSKSSVAKVSSKGVITGVKAGSATITAYFKYKGKTYSKTCKVAVKKRS